MKKLSRIFWSTWHRKNTSENSVLKGLVWSIPNAKVTGQEWALIPGWWLAEQAALVLAFPTFEHMSVQKEKIMLLFIY